MKQHPYLLRGKRILLVVIIFCLFSTLLYFGSLFYAHGFSPRFLAIDGCLDNGGRWDYEKNVCDNGLLKN